LTTKELSELLAKRLKLEKEKLKLEKEKEKEIHKADIMNFEEEKSYDYTSDWSDTLLRVFDHYIKYLKGKRTGSVPDPWLCDKLTPLRLADLDKKKELLLGPVMFGEFLSVFLKNPFHSPFRYRSDRYQLPTKHGWRRVNHSEFFTRVRDYLWYHFRLWSKDLLVVIGELEMSPRSYGDKDRLKNLAPLLAKRVNEGVRGTTYICEDDQVRFVQKWLAPRINEIPDIPCINIPALNAMLTKCGGLGMITF